VRLRTDTASGTPQDAAMTTRTLVDNPLNSASRQLSDVFHDRGLLKSAIDAGSVKRMLVHINNINHAVLASTRDHVSAATRLEDFALTLERIARDSHPPETALSEGLKRVADDLHAASKELLECHALPPWQPSAPSTKVSVG
jgi:hypothetical protein